ncbi:hypothetical protein R6Q57_006164 [Mikania cordata]
MEEMVGIDLLMATRVEFRLTASLVSIVPFHYPSWDRVPEHDKLGIYRTLHVNIGIEKNELKRHFDAYGGYDNVENEKNHLPDTQTQEAWEKIIDELFLNADFMKRSVKNASNRSKQLYATAGGSRSYTQTRHEDMRDTGTSSMLKDWKKMHTKKGDGWVNEIVEDDWVNILILCYHIELEEEAARMCKESGTEQIDEEECLSRVLGDRHGWNRGVGRRLRNIAPDVSYVSNSQSQFSDMQEKIRLMNENMRRMQDEIDALKSKKHATSTDSDED